MKISAIDIKKQKFKKSFKGYDVVEVEAYLDTVANQIETLFKDNEDLKEKIRQIESEKENLNHEIQIYRDNEKTFQKAIVKSQDMSEEVLENAKKRAELIIKESEIISTKIRLQAKEEIMHLRQELEDLRIKNENIIEDIKNYLIEKLNSIEEYSKNRTIYKLESNISELNDVNSGKENEISKDFDLNLSVDPEYSGQ